MQENQPKALPKASYLGQAAALLVLAVVLLLVPDTVHKPEGIPLVDPRFYDTTPVERIPQDELVTADDHTRCSKCHEPGESLDDVGTKGGGNHEKHLQHGRNNKCFHCHNPKNMDTFQNRDGEPIQYKDVVYLCVNCHGPQYRDWKAGIHGRRSGYFDGRGPTRELRCSECHNPHKPSFPWLRPAPGPNARHGHPPGRASEHPHEGGGYVGYPDETHPKGLPSARPANLPDDPWNTPSPKAPTESKGGSKS